MGALTLRSSSPAAPHPRPPACRSCPPSQSWPPTAVKQGGQQCMVVERGAECPRAGRQTGQQVREHARSHECAQGLPPSPALPPAHLGHSKVRGDREDGAHQRPHHKHPAKMKAQGDSVGTRERSASLAPHSPCMHHQPRIGHSPKVGPLDCHDGGAQGASGVDGAAVRVKSRVPMR